ncbi:MAG: thiamine diphosphokinase [Treponema sp.]|jgi:thiamine pyrophosphokinase|nr:thiamine diphosphokinase [Treponema sp.]
MRGIAFIGGEGPAETVCRRLAGAACLVVAADSGLIAAEKAGIRPDWIVGDMDSLDDPGRLDSYPPERVVRYPCGKDFTDTELALKLLWEQGCGEAWLFGGGGGRTDHLLAIRSLFERDPSPDRWITGREDIRRLGCGGRLDFPGTGGGALRGISVFPLGAGPWKAESLGLKWPLGGLAWDRGFFGISNEAPEGGFSVSAVLGDFLILSPLI